MLALQTQQKAGRNVEELAPCTLLTGAQNGTSISGKGLAVTYKLNNYLLYDPAISILFTQEKWKHMSTKKDLCLNVYSSFLHDSWKTDIHQWSMDKHKQVLTSLSWTLSSLCSSNTFQFPGLSLHAHSQKTRALFSLFYCAFLFTSVPVPISVAKWWVNRERKQK